MDKSLKLSDRKEETRVIASPIRVVKYELQEIKQHFDESISVIQEQFDVADYLAENGKQDQACHVWRAQVVFLESAFDFFMHELTKYGLGQIYDSNWKATDKYKNIQIDMKTVARALRDGKDSDWFLEYINGYYAGDTLVSYDSFRRQMNLLGLNIQMIADEAFYARRASEKTKEIIKRVLNQLFTRRNLIAHQSDRRHEDAVTNMISREVVDRFIADMNKIVNAIIKVASDM